MNRIRCGVIGLGWFGEHHVDTLQQLPLVEVDRRVHAHGKPAERGGREVPRAQGLHGLQGDARGQEHRHGHGGHSHQGSRGADGRRPGGRQARVSGKADGRQHRGLRQDHRGSREGRHLLHGRAHLPLRHGLRAGQGRDRGGEPRHDHLDARAAEPGQVDHPLAPQEDLRPLRRRGARPGPHALVQRREAEERLRAEPQHAARAAQRRPGVGHVPPGQRGDRGDRERVVPARERAVRDRRAAWRSSGPRGRSTSTTRASATRC